MTLRRILSQVAAVLALVSTSTAQAPANDDCATAQAILLGTTAFDSSLATDGVAQPLDPMICDFGPFGDEQVYQDVWFTYSPTATDNYDFSAVANGFPAFDSRIAVYDIPTCPDDPMSVIGCDDDSGGMLQALVKNVPLTVGSSYFVRVGSYDNITAEQPADLFIAIHIPPIGVPNDDCQNAQVVTVGDHPYDSRNAADGTALPLDPMVCDFGTFGDEQIYQDVWFSFAPMTTGTFDILSINNGNPPFDSRIAIYDQTTCPSDPADVIACNEDMNAAFEAGVSNLVLNQGTDYLIRLGSFDAVTAEEPAVLSITFTGLVAPANDDCANATIASLGLNPMDTRVATNGSGLPMNPLFCSIGGDEQIYADAWWLFTAPASDQYTIGVVNNGNPSFDSRLAVYNQSTCPDDPSFVLACNEDAGPGLQAEVSNLFLSAGQTVLIRAGSFSPGTMSELAALSIMVSPPGPPNDNCANAQVVNAFGTYPFDNTFSTTDGSDLAGFCDLSALGGADDEIFEDVWFAYTPLVGGCTYISLLGFTNWDSRLAVYDSTTCPDDPASVIACSDDEVQNPTASPFEAGLDVQLTAGNTYLIRVGNFGVDTTGGAGSLRIDAGPLAVANDQGLQPGAPGCPSLPTYTSLCNGDGGNQVGCTDCPCGNNAPMGTIGGCINSSGFSTRLSATGHPSVSSPSGDTSDLRMTLSGAPATAFCVMLSGGAVAPQGMSNPCFGLNSGVQSVDRDGLRCAVSGGQGISRHGGRSADAQGLVNASSGPSRVWGGEASPAIGLAQQAGFSAGQTRMFQVTHREDPISICMRGLNTSQAVEVTFTP